MMAEEEMVFWLIHIFIGLLLPFLILSGCCREEEEQAEVQSTKQN
jgi:hypothetical protein